jgi:hypothetical protein
MLIDLYRRRIKQQCGGEKMSYVTNDYVERLKNEVDASTRSLRMGRNNSPSRTIQFADCREYLIISIRISRYLFFPSSL